MSANVTTVCWNFRTLLHVCKSIWTFVFIQNIYFHTNLLHITWNLSCPIIVHFIFVMLPQIHKITSMENIILGGHPVTLVGQAKDFHQHHIWLPWTGENISLNAAHIPCNDQLWCPHMQHSWHQQRHLWLYSFHLHSQKMVWLCCE